MDDAVLEFRASVPSADYGKAKVGAAVDVTVDALGGRTVKGTVARVSPLVEERTRSFEVDRSRCPASASWWAASSPARRCAWVACQARSWSRPRRCSATAASPTRPQAFVVADGKAERKTVTLGVETADAIQVTKGLAAGDLVVLDPPVALSSGAPVELTTTQELEAAPPCS